MITWFQVAYISAKMVQTNTYPGKVILTPMETGDNEEEYSAGLDAYVDIET